MGKKRKLKFKVGDRVRCVDHYDIATPFLSGVVITVDPDDDLTYRVKLDLPAVGIFEGHEKLWYMEKDLELASGLERAIKRCSK